ncbi:helix-turn-helix domain-containing protein [Streptomyces sp. NBC_00893]|uniref:helix-turn-helix domain-containing protein n=1 Tax=Streptomyces sp. NBC_00893 TaxID=2975862 RepID=UPI00225A9DC9|nr:helix-turn-helix domain-containing protein [Streptomyces sp. NBC_00893]MCX4851281.1 helix-turn-helix domain-containing protein [Streptomyces sp. NBC_00893]
MACQRAGAAAADRDPFLPIGPSVVPVAVACAIFLTAIDRKRLKKVARGHKSEYRQRVRAQIVLHAARGRSNARIARETGLHLDTVRRWREVVNFHWSGCAVAL